MSKGGIQPRCVSERITLGACPLARRFPPGRTGDFRRGWGGRGCTAKRAEIRPNPAARPRSKRARWPALIADLAAGTLAAFSGGLATAQTRRKKALHIRHRILDNPGGCLYNAPTSSSRSPAMPPSWVWLTIDGKKKALSLRPPWSVDGVGSRA